jgi:hypothetical protein
MLERKESDVRKWSGTTQKTYSVQLVFFERGGLIAQWNIIKLPQNSPHTNYINNHTHRQYNVTETTMWCWIKLELQLKRITRIHV